MTTAGLKQCREGTNKSQVEKSPELVQKKAHHSRKKVLQTRKKNKQESELALYLDKISFLVMDNTI